MHVVVFSAGIDAGLESILSADKYLCDACFARVSTPIFVVFDVVFSPQKFLGEGVNFSQKKTISLLFSDTSTRIDLAYVLKCSVQ